MLFKEHGLAALPLCTLYDALVQRRCRPVIRLLRWSFRMQRVSLPGNRQEKGYSRLEDSSMRLHQKGKSASTGGSYQAFNQSLIFVSIAITLLLGVRCVALAGGLPSFSSSDNPASRSNSFLARTLTFLYLPVLNLNLLLCPITLSFDWSMDAVPLVKSIGDKRNFATVAMYGCFSFLFGKLIFSTPVRHLLNECINSWLCRISLFSKGCFRSVIKWINGVNSEAIVSLFAICMSVLPFLPATNLIAYVGFVVAERVLYVPSMGYCLLQGIGLYNLLRFTSLSYKGSNRQLLKILIICAAILLVIVFSVRTVIRSEDWRDEERLYRSGINVNPAKAYGNLGNILSNLGRIEEAEIAYRKALKHRPNMADAHFNLGLLLQNKGELQEAIECYEKATQYRPTLAVAHLNMGLTLVRMGKWKDGIKKLRLLAERGGEKIGDASLLKDPRSHEIALASARFHLGRLLAQRGELSEALDILKDALNRIPPHYSQQSLLNMLGEVYRQMGKESEAETWFRASLQSKPDHIPAYLTYARLLADNKTRLPEAEKQYLKALKIAPHDTSALHQYGHFLAEQGRHTEAAETFRSATEILQPPHFEDVMAAATSYRLSGNLQKAESYYRMGVHLQPQLHSAHVNLGALLHLMGQFEEAEKCYQKALSLKPGDQLTKTNLQRLHASKFNNSNSYPVNSSKPVPTSEIGMD